MSKTNQGESHYNYGLPTIFMYEGLIYEKSIGGYYYMFEPNKARNTSTSVGKITQIEAEHLITNSAYISTILVVSNKRELKI